MTPAIGRRLQYWGQHSHPQHVRDEHQPFMADIVFVHDDKRVAVRIHDHYGASIIEDNVEVHPTASGGERHGTGNVGYCTWPRIN